MRSKAAHETKVRRRKSDLVKARCGAVRYVICRRNADARAVADWLARGDFRRYEDAAYKPAKDFGITRRNALYAFKPPWSQREVVMKVSQPHPDYGFWRRFNFYLSQLYRSYGERAFYGACLLQRAGVRVAPPIACWKLGGGLATTKSYSLNYRITGVPLTDLYEYLRHGHDGDSDAFLEAVLRKVTATARKLHDANLRHGDLYAGNCYFDITTDDNGAALQADDVNNADMCLLDYDHCRRVWLRIPGIKTFFDLSCLHKVSPVFFDEKTLLTMYFGDDFPHRWLTALSFWHNGGFKLRRWLRKITSC